MDLEHIYDEQISPLMAQIIKIAKEHDMPFIASFQLTDAEDEEEPLMCTSCQTPEGCTEKLVQAKNILYSPSSATTLTLTARDANGAITAIEHIIFDQ
jgi:hypothetical protein